MEDRVMEAQEGMRAPLRPTKKSWGAILFLGVLLAILAIGRNDLAAAEWHAIFGHENWMARMDWLLLGLFLFFLISFSLDPVFKIDMATIAAGFVGGTLIEIWGTQTGLWYYYTFETPPLWILPAWSASALANEKILRMLLIPMPEAWREKILTDQGGGWKIRALHLMVGIPILAFYTYWSSPSITHPISIVVTILIFTAVLRHRFPYYAFLLFCSGILLGVFLEIWGTTRHCWNYYDGKTPSPFPIVGHGMAAVAFWRAKSGVKSVVSWVIRTSWVVQALSKLQRSSFWR